MSLALGFRKLTSWHWNRFIVPLERGPHGILAGHAVLGVQKPPAAGNYGPKMVREALKRRKLETLTPFRVPEMAKIPKEQKKFIEMRDKQLAFSYFLQLLN